MAIVTRLSRLFRADLNAVLDRIEEPDIVLREAVREMEDALAASERRLKLLRHEHGQITAALAGAEQAIAQLDHELDTCFACGKEDLARALVRRKLEARQRLKLAAQREQSLSAAIASLEGRIAGERTRLEDMRRKAEILAAEKADVAGPCVPDPVACVRDDEVEVAFLLEKQKRRAP